MAGETTAPNQDPSLGVEQTAPVSPGIVQSQETVPQQPVDPVQAQLDAQAQALKDMEGRYSKELRERDLQIARLEGRNEAMQQGGGGQAYGQPQPFFDHDAQYRLAAVRIEAQLQSEDASTQARAQQEKQVLEQNYQVFLQQQGRKQTERQQREISRTHFLASRGIALDSQQAKVVSTLHDQGMPLETIEQEYWVPRVELSKLKGGAHGQQQTAAHLQAATTVGDGVARGAPPPPVSAEAQKARLTGDEYARESMVSMFEQQAPSLEQTLFGSL